MYVCMYTYVETHTYLCIMKVKLEMSRFLFCSHHLQCDHERCWSSLLSSLKWVLSRDSSISGEVFTPTGSLSSHQNCHLPQPRSQLPAPHSQRECPSWVQQPPVGTAVNHFSHAILVLHPDLSSKSSMIKFHTIEETDPNSQETKSEVPTIFLRPKFQGISPQNMAKNMVQYPHFRFLKFPLNCWLSQILIKHAHLMIKPTTCSCFTHIFGGWIPKGTDWTYLFPSSEHDLATHSHGRRSKHRPCHGLGIGSLPPTNDDSHGQC